MRDHEDVIVMTLCCMICSGGLMLLFMSAFQTVHEQTLTLYFSIVLFSTIILAIITLRS